VLGRGVGLLGWCRCGSLWGRCGSLRVVAGFGGCGVCARLQSAEFWSGLSPLGRVSDGSGIGLGFCFLFWVFLVAVPDQPPAEFNATPSSSTSITATWSSVPSGHGSGVITGYRVLYMIDGM